MKRHKALIPLSHDHHHGLLLAQLVKKNVPDYKGLHKNLEGKIKYILSAIEKKLLSSAERKNKNCKTSTLTNNISKDFIENQDNT